MSPSRTRMDHGPTVTRINPEFSAWFSANSYLIICLWFASFQADFQNWLRRWCFHLTCSMPLALIKIGLIVFWGSVLSTLVSKRCHYFVSTSLIALLSYPCKDIKERYSIFAITSPPWQFHCRIIIIILIFPCLQSLWTARVSFIFSAKVFSPFFSLAQSAIQNIKRNKYILIISI